jgi:hypothetical protein
MRIGTVAVIAGAHDARNASSRLTVPVPDGCCRVRILARTRTVAAPGRRQLTPALLGVG